jgi:hypothetical protein
LFCLVFNLIFLKQNFTVIEKQLKNLITAEEVRLATNQDIPTQTSFETFNVSIQTEFKVPGMTLKQTNSQNDFPSSIGRFSRLPNITPAGLQNSAGRIAWAGPRPSTSAGSWRGGGTFSG